MVLCPCSLVNFTIQGLPVSCWYLSNHRDCSGHETFKGLCYRCYESMTTTYDYSFIGHSYWRSLKAPQINLSAWDLFLMRLQNPDGCHSIEAESKSTEGIDDKLDILVNKFVHATSGSFVHTLMFSYCQICCLATQTSLRRNTLERILSNTWNIAATPPWNSTRNPHLLSVSHAEKSWYL